VLLRANCTSADGGVTRDVCVSSLWSWPRALLARVFNSVISLPLGAIALSRFHETDPEVLRHGAVEST
jgi:hypothetical protein